MIQQGISSMKLRKLLLTRLTSHSNFSTHCTNLFLPSSCVFTFLEIIKHNRLKRLCIFFIFSIKVATQKFTNFDKLFFKMHADMTAVTIQTNKIVYNEVKDKKVLPDPSYGKNQMNFLANPIELYAWNLYNFINQCHPNKFNKTVNNNKHCPLSLILRGVLFLQSALVLLSPPAWIPFKPLKKAKNNPSHLFHLFRKYLLHAYYVANILKCWGYRTWTLTSWRLQSGGVDWQLIIIKWWGRIGYNGRTCRGTYTIAWDGRRKNSLLEDFLKMMFEGWVRIGEWKGREKRTNYGSKLQKRMRLYVSMQNATLKHLR